MGFIERAAALALASSMLGSPAVGKTPETIYSDSSPETPIAVELERTKYDLPLEILKDMVDVSSPAVEEVFEVVSQDPEGHIEIVDSFGYGDYPFTPDGYSYYIFPDNQIEDEIDPPWSALIFVDSVNNEPGTATIILQVNEGLEIYKGRRDSIPYYPIPEEILEQVSDEIFNEPDFLSEKPWNLIPDTSVPMLGRSHIDENGGHFEQVVTAQNLIIFSSPYPFPENIAGKPQEVTAPDSVS